MAAPLRCMTFCKENFCKKLIRSSLSSFSTSSKRLEDASPKLEDRDEIQAALDAELKREYEREVYKLRDVSNMTKYAKARNSGVFIDDFLKSDKLQQTRKFYRKMYATYGSASGLDPSKIWPSKEEMKSLIEDDMYWEPKFQDMVAKIQAEKAESQQEAIERDLKIEKSMEKMDKLIKDYKAKLVKEAKEEKKSSDFNVRLLKEFRDTYGYSVPEKSYRFKEFKSQKLEEMRNKRKADKKQEKIDVRKKFIETMD